MSKENSKKFEDFVIKPNLDLYPTSKDVDVSFYQELYKFKSVEDYLKSKKRKKNKSKKRKLALAMICNGSDVNFLDFPSGTEGIPASPGVSGANQIGGLLDHITLRQDEEGNDRYNNLNYAVQKDSSDPGNIDLEQRINEILNPTNHNPGAIPDGISNLEEEGRSNYDSSGYNGTSYVTTDVGTGIYNNNHFQI